MRRTLNAPVTLEGVGLHGGGRVRLEVRPAASGHGIAFLRSDRPDGENHIPARHDRVVDTRLCTRLANAAGTGVGTVEHLMAALAGLGITDALVVLDGPEVPIMDGSSAPFVDAFMGVGLRRLPGSLRAIRVLSPVEVRDGDKRAALLPYEGVSVGFCIDFEDAAIGRQALSLDLAGEAFVRHLADCRTFGRLSDVERLRSLGLGRGGSLDNAVVIDGARVLNPGGLRRADEFVRHKMLDALGDLALAGHPILGRYEGERAGHEMTNLLLHALFERTDAWEWVEVAGSATGAVSGALGRCFGRCPGRAPSGTPAHPAPRPGRRSPPRGLKAGTG